MSNLLTQLLAFYKEDPADPFNIYGLALEYQKIDIEKAISFFEELLKNHPNYIATYYHAAALYDSIGNVEQANNVYLKGIAVAKEFKKNHALAELERSYQSFLIENNL